MVIPKTKAITEPESSGSNAKDIKSTNLGLATHLNVSFHRYLFNVVSLMYVQIIMLILSKETFNLLSK